MIVCEALDRLGRKLSDVADLHDRLQFHDTALHAVNLGPITTTHVGLLGTMAQLYLSDLKDKTKRGQLGRALAGKIPADKVARLEEALNDPAIKTEAAEILRGLIGRIDLVPPDDGPGLEAHLYGDLARILAFCEGATGKGKLPSSGEPGSRLSVVAGARNRLYLLTLATRPPKIR